MTAPSILLEAYLGGAWQDLTGSLLASHGRGVRISRGRANEAGSAQPGRCEFALESRTGEWTEGSPASHPDWAAGARVRVTVNGTVRFAGTISSPVTRWPDREDALHAVTTVTATDVIADLAADQLMVHPATLLLAGLGATALWPLDDPAGSTLARSLVPGVPPLEFGTNLDGHPLDPQTLYHFGVSAPEGGPRTGSWLGLTPAVDGPPLWHAWATPRGTRQLPSSAVPVTVLGWHTRTTAPLEVTTLLMRLGPIAVYQLTDGYLQLEYASTATLAGATPLDTPVLLALVVTATTATLHSSAGGSVSVAVDPGAIDYPWFEVGASPSYGDPGSTGLWSNIATVPAVLSLADVRSLAGRAAATQGAPVSSWLAAAAGETVQVLGYDRPMLAPATHGVSPAGIGDSLADVAGAMWVADRASDQPTWIDPRWVGPVTALPGEAVDLDRLEWAADRSLRVTDVTSEGRLLASSGLAPRVSRDLAPLLRPIDLQGRAEWLANTGGVMGSPRLGGVGIDLLTWPWADAQLNPVANPSFESTSGTVEVARSYFQNPNLTTLNYIALNRVADAVLSVSDGWAVAQVTASPGAGTNGISFTSSIGPANQVAGDSWAASFEVEAEGIGAGSWTTNAILHNGVQLVSKVFDLHAGRQTVQIPAVTLAGAGVSPLRMFVYFGGDATNWPVGSKIKVRRPLIWKAPAAGLLPPAWWSGNHSPDPDLTPSWAGAVDNSDSILTAPGVANVNAAPANVKTYSSTAWAKDGARSVRTDRIAPGATNHWTVFPSVPNVTGQLYTVLLCLRTVEPVPVDVLLDRTGLPSITFYSGSVDGEVIVRGTFTGNAAGTNPRLGIQHNGTVGQVIWMDCYAVIEGDYAGGWFPDTLPGTADLLALDLRHRVRISDPPPQVPSVLRTATVEGYEETVALDQWALTLNLAPDPRGIWGDPVQGVLGAAADNRYGT